MSEKGNKVLYIVLSLLFAIAFWLYVDNEQGNTITNTFYDIPVEFIGETDTLPSRGLMLANSEGVTVDIELRGPRSVITGLSRNDLSIQVNLTNISAVGTYPLTYELLTPDNVSRSSVVIEKASVSTVTVRIVEMYEKVVPVYVNVVGEVAENHIYMAQNMIAQPSVITISGREEDVDPIKSAEIEIDISNASATVNREVSYELLDEEKNVVVNDAVRVSDRQIVVVVPVYEVKTLPLTVNFSEAPGSTLDHVDWEMSIDSIEVAGEATSLAAREEISLGVINLSSLLSDTDLEMDIRVPTGCVNLSGANSVTVSVRFKDLETRAFSVTDITAVGLSENQTFSRVTNTVDVVVRGSAQDLEMLLPENIRIVVDLSQYVFNGTYSVPATVQIDGSGRVGAVGSYSVACKISGGS